MPRRLKDPASRLHTQSGQATVTLPDGLGGQRDVLLGPYDTDASREEILSAIEQGDPRDAEQLLPLVYGSPTVW